MVSAFLPSGISPGCPLREDPHPPPISGRIPSPRFWQHLAGSGLSNHQWPFFLLTCCLSFQTSLAQFTAGQLQSKSCSLASFARLSGALPLMYTCSSALLPINLPPPSLQFDPRDCPPPPFFAFDLFDPLRHGSTVDRASVTQSRKPK